MNDSATPGRFITLPPTSWNDLCTELLLTHVPLRHVPEGCVNVHGHRHMWNPSGTRHINVVVEQVRYRPRSLLAVRRLAASLAAGKRVPGRTTAEQLTHVGPADAAGSVTCHSGDHVDR